MAPYDTVFSQFRFTSPRLRREVGSHRRCDPGEGGSPRVQLSPSLWKLPLTLTLAPLAGRGEEELSML